MKPITVNQYNGNSFSATSCFYGGVVSGHSRTHGQPKSYLIVVVSQSSYSWFSDLLIILRTSLYVRYELPYLQLWEDFLGFYAQMSFHLCGKFDINKIPNCKLQTVTIYCINFTKTTYMIISSARLRFLMLHIVLK